MSDASPLRVLILADSAGDAEMVSRELCRAGVSHVSEHVGTPADFLASLDPPPDLILADYRLSSFDALAALRTLRARHIHVPVVVISGAIGEEAAVECLREGAADYLLKSSLGQLGPTVRHALEEARLRDQQRYTAEALRESEERYRSLVEEAPNPMWVVDAETLRFLEVNRKAIDHYGYSREEFLAMTLLEIRPPEDIPIALLAVGKVLAGSPMAVPVRHRTKGGQMLEVLVSSRPVTFAGRPALMAIINDVTERHRLEAQLLQAQKLEAIGRLAGGIAHDFNNLLMTIRGFADLVTARADNRPDLLAPAEEIRQAGERAATLTRQLLAFSRQQALEPRVVDLNEVVAGIEAMLRQLIGERCACATALQAEPCPVLVDRSQLERVIVNLVINARDAMPDGGRLTIETARLELEAAGPGAPAGAASGPHVMLAVSDTGHGMDAETRARIFEPFFTTKAPGKGTGLGLATVYGIVHQSGGHLGVASEPGRGSTFKIYFPRAAGLAERSRQPAVQPAPGGKETVLVIEDDPALCRLVCAMLEEGGYAVLPAETPAAAIALAAAHTGSISLVLSDVRMPGTSGPGVVAQLVPLRPGIGVLYMSGDSGSVAGHRDLQPPGARLLGKPFTRQGLLRQVREILDEAGAGRRPVH